VEIAFAAPVDVGPDPFLITRWHQITAGWGFLGQNLADAGLCPRLFKYYTDPGDPRYLNWWIRSYVEWMEVIVEYYGDRGPVISNVTELGTAVSTDARTVEATITDDNPGEGPAGVAHAYLHYSVNDGAVMQVEMSGPYPDDGVYSRTFPDRHSAARCRITFRPRM
jgi:hypothetical protein